MKLTIASLLAGSAAAFTTAPSAKTSTAMNAFSFDTIPGALAPMGLFDPLGFAAKADEEGLKKYREAELTHGRVAMLAVVGFLVGEAVESKTFLFNGEITGPAIDQLQQVNPILFALLAALIGKAETKRAELGWVEPSKVRYDRPGQLRDEYIPGNLGFDPLQLKPEDPEEFFEMQNKELQNGRLAMLAAAGFMAQELTDGLGIVEHYQVGL
ncbi:hypothetical protein ACHAXR_000871, partial [Thalassiosira sp. AJA248-18]